MRTKQLLRCLTVTSYLTHCGKKILKSLHSPPGRSGQHVAAATPIASHRMQRRRRRCMQRARRGVRRGERSGKCHQRTPPDSTEARVAGMCLSAPLSGRLHYLTVRLVGKDQPTCVQVDSVAEFGVDYGQSTVALLAGSPKSLR